LTRKAIERNAEKRALFVYHIGIHFTPEQLVFVDESACDRRTAYRGKAWAFRGQRAVRKAFFVRGKRCVLQMHILFFPILILCHRYSVLPALSLDGILSVNIVQGSFNQTTFAEFIEGLLDTMNPFPGPKSVIVMDNCTIHHTDLVLDMIRNRFVLP
jgi:DDE superfamily endonuclease